MKTVNQLKSFGALFLTLPFLCEAREFAVQSFGGAFILNPENSPEKGNYEFMEGSNEVYDKEDLQAFLFDLDREATLKPVKTLNDLKSPLSTDDIQMFENYLQDMANQKVTIEHKGIYLYIYTAESVMMDLLRLLAEKAELRFDTKKEIYYLKVGQFYSL